MIYDHSNVMHKTRVYDVDTKEVLGHVIEINTRAGWVKVAEDPIRVNPHQHLASKRIHFDSIHAIKGAEPLPCLFHCYGRKGAIECKPDGRMSPAIHGDGTGQALPALQ